MLIVGFIDECLIFTSAKLCGRNCNSESKHKLLETRRPTFLGLKKLACLENALTRTWFLISSLIEPYPCHDNFKKVLLNLKRGSLFIFERQRLLFFKCTKLLLSYWVKSFSRKKKMSSYWGYLYDLPYSLSLNFAWNNKQNRQQRIID